jgi:hypothetical protein
MVVSEETQRAFEAASAAPFRCCLMTRDPGNWTAGVNDTADPRMITAMHNIRNRLSYKMPINELIWALKASIQIDSRTMLGGDIQRCLISNAAHRLDLLAKKIDPAPWRSLTDRLKDCWAIIQRRGVCIRTSGSVYDRPKPGQCGDCGALADQLCKLNPPCVRTKE